MIDVPHIMVIDPGVHTPEVDTFNHIAAMAPIPCSYHLPAMHGFASFPNDISQVRGIIVLGSAASVHDRASWQISLEEWLRPVIELSVPVLGCCYGHQMLAYMFGGEIGFVRADQSKLKGVRQVEILNNDLCHTGARSLIVTHAEMVQKLPSSMRVIARSSEVAIDGLVHQNKPVFGFQAHPEATEVFLHGHEMHEAQAVAVLSEGHQLIRTFVDKAAARSL
jgi:GMP synthase-like glutamine amidotransferase